MIGHLNGVEVEIEAHWRDDGVEGEFFVRGKGAEVVAGAHRSDSEVVYSGPVQHSDGRYRVVVRVRIETFSAREGREGEPHGTFRSSGQPIEATLLNEPS